MTDSPELSGATPADAPTKDEERLEPSTFTLQIVSPSVGVATPLRFSQLPTTTRVKELKAKIRDVLPSKPVDENQRLIHRGRMLGNENETMESVFGQAALETSQVQTLHLVLRPSPSDPPPAALPTPISAQPATGLPTLPQPRTQATPLNTGNATSAQLQAHFHELQRHNSQLHHNMQEAQAVHQRLQEQVLEMEQRYRQALAAAAQTHPQVAALPRFSQPIPAPPSVQALLDQRRDRVARGRQMVQESTARSVHSGIPSGTPSQSGRSTPVPSHTATIVQQATGPNGETWRTTTTINETRTTITTPVGVRHTVNSPVGAAPADGTPYNPVPEMIAHMQANARASSRPPPGSNMPPHLAVPRSASNPPSRYPSPHIGAGIGSVNSSQAGLPNTNILPETAGLIPPQFSATQGVPTVYILSSSLGPQALLVTSQNTHLSRPQPRGQIPVQDQELIQRPPVVLPEYRNRHAGRIPRRPAGQEGEVAPAVLGAHANANAPAGALAARLPNILWLVVRLVGFVYFFTNGNASWGRWLLMTTLSFIVLLANLGLFNGLVNGLWAPIRAHVENIIPLAGPDAALIPAVNAAPIPNPQPGAAPQAGANEPIRTGPHGELDPQQVANRIIAQQRQQQQQAQGWLRARMRRVEHSLLLFMASLVPGVGERHIAAREAEANERQRQIDSAAAAAAEAAAALNNASAEEEAGETAARSENVDGTGEVEPEPQEGQNQERRRVPFVDGQAV